MQFVDSGDLLQAMKVFSEIYPPTSKILYNIGSLILTMQEGDRAIFSHQDAAQSDKWRKASIWNESELQHDISTKASIYTHEYVLEKALEAYIQSTKLDAFFAIGHFQCGYLFEALERHEEAIQAYLACISVNFGFFKVIELP